MSFIDSMKFIQVIRDDADLLSATPDDVLVGKVFVGKAKKFQTGLIPVTTITSDKTLACGESYTVPYGHTTVAYKVRALSLADQTPGNVAAADILIGKIAWSNGTKITGTMSNQGAVAITLACGESYTVSNGYHNGSGTVTAKSLADQTVGTAIASDILIGKRAWVSGIELTGTMLDNTPTETTLQAGNSYTIAEGYHHGTGKVTAATLASQTAGTAVAADIVSGKTAWANGVKITGTVTKIAAQEITLPLNGTYTIPSGIHSGLGTVTQNIPTQSAFTITPSFKSQTIDVMGKYNTGNITVTGINALNYNTSGLDGGAKVIDVTVNGTNNETYLICPLTNWYDGFTINVFSINVDFIDSSDTKYASVSTMLCNGDNGAILTYFNSIDLLPNEETSYMKMSTVATPDGIMLGLQFAFGNDYRTKYSPPSKLKIRVNNVISLRQFGDAHDTD